MNLADSRRAKATCVLVSGQNRYGQNRGLESVNARVFRGIENCGRNAIVN